MNDIVIAKPRPVPTRESQPYWDGLASGKLILQACADCGKTRHYPRPVCDSCFSTKETWVEAQGRGCLHSWTVAHHAFHPAFKGELPSILGLVDLAEGVRVNAPLRGLAEADLRIGMSLKLLLERAEDGFVTPAFALA